MLPPYPSLPEWRRAVLQKRVVIRLFIGLRMLLTDGLLHQMQPSVSNWLAHLPEL